MVSVLIVADSLAVVANIYISPITSIWKMVSKNDKRHGGQLQKAVQCQYDNQQNSMIVKCQYDSLLNTMRSWERSVVCYDIISCHPLVFEELVSSDTENYKRKLN